MKVPLQITVRGFPHSEALDTHIRDKAAKLEEFFEHVVSCRVVVEIPHKHHNQGRQFSVRIDLGVPGNQIVVNRDHHEDVYVALRDAFAAARRQLEDYVHCLHGEIKNHIPEYVGSVAQLFGNEGYGFIERADGMRFYFHQDNVVSPSFNQLKLGDEVKFIEGAGAEGLQAKRVTVGKHHLP